MNNNTRALAADLAADVTIHNHGTVWTFTPNNSHVKEWIAANVTVPEWACLGNSFAADHRPAVILAEALESAGFFVHFHQSPKGQL